VRDLWRRAPEDRACCGASARKEDADAALPPSKRFMPVGVQWTRAQLEALPGLCLHDLMLMPIDRLRLFFDRMGGRPGGAACANRAPSAFL
jgi:excinuclease ABC subunit A